MLKRFNSKTKLCTDNQDIINLEKSTTTEHNVQIPIQKLGKQIQKCVKKPTRVFTVQNPCVRANTRPSKGGGNAETATSISCETRKDSGNKVTVFLLFHNQIRFKNKTHLHCIPSREMNQQDCFVFKLLSVINYLQFF